MANVLGNNIQCDNCRRFLMPMRFSESSIRKYREPLSKQRRSPGEDVRLPRCLDCNPQSRTELECAMCGATRPLEYFSKSQRKTGDNAQCLDCVETKLGLHPDHGVNVEKIRIVEDMERKRILDLSNYYSNASRLPSTRASQTISERYETETNPGSDSWTHGNGPISYASSTYTDSPPTSRVATGTAWDNFAGDMNRVRASPSTVSTNKGFVKQAAVPKNAHQKAQEHVERERARIEAERNKDLKRADSDEGSEDEDDIDPY